MQNIDFLPAKYREQAFLRKKKVWQVIVVALFGAAVSATALFQFAVARSVRLQLVDLEPQHAAAKGTNEKLAQVQSQLLDTRTIAGLYVYLEHPWPRTQLLAEIAKPLPTTMNLASIRLEQESLLHAAPKPRPAASPEHAEKTPEIASPPAERDLKRLRERHDQTRTVIHVSGITTDSSALHAYVAELAKVPLFTKVELGSLESLDGKGYAGGAKFQLRLIVRPGHGQTGGPHGETLVPTLRVGTHASDALRRFRDAERPDLRSHAERGNENI